MIEDFSFWQDPAWVAAVTGLAAIGLSFVNLVFQKRQAAFRIRTALKEKWVNEFKDNLASYMTCSARIHDVFAEGVDFGRLNSLAHVADEKEAFKEYNFYNEKGHELSQRISLFLNEKIPVHSKLAYELGAADVLLQEWKNEILSDKVNENKRIEIRNRALINQNKIRETARDIIAYELKELF